MAIEVVRAIGSGNRKRCALLLGWTGGAIRHVAKHTGIWSGLGVSSVVVDISLRDTFLPREETGRLWDKAREALNVIRSDLGAEDVVVHCFSNGGCLLFVTILEELQKERRRLDSGEDDGTSAAVPSIIGAVYDSCPIPSVHPVHGPLLTLVTPLPWREKLAILRDLVPYAVSSTIWQPFRGNPIGWYGGLRDPAINSVRPELFMYSRGDSLGPAPHVEAFASLRTLQGARVTMHRFLDGSPHVQHYRSRQEEYENATKEWALKDLSW